MSELEMVTVEIRSCPNFDPMFLAATLQLTINISQSFQEGACTNVFAELSHKVWYISAHNENLEEKFSFKESAFNRLNHQFMLCRSEDYDFISSCSDTTDDDKHPQIVHRGIPCRNIQIGLICSSWKLWRKNLFIQRESILPFQSVINTQKSR